MHFASLLRQKIKTPNAFLALATFFLVGLAPPPAEAQIRTVVTDHFRIHYMDGASGTARRVAETAEEGFTPLAAAYDYYDDFSPIHVIVVDNSDMLGNGSADYYSNTIVIWATHLDNELRGNHDWIRNVMTHELAHIMTLNKAHKKWPFQYALLSVSRSGANPDVTFNLPFFHMNAPRWWAEGIAQYATDQLGFESWDTHRDMLLRMAVLEDDLLTYEEMGTVRNRTGGYYGEMLYNQGYALLSYIDKQYGRDKVEALTHHTGTLSFDPAISEVLGISADQLYKDWVDHLERHYRQQEEKIYSRTLFAGEPLEPLNEGIVEYYPVYAPDGDKLAYITSEQRDFPISRLAIYDFATREKKKLKGFVDTRISWSPDGEEIVFARNKSGFDDLFIYHLERDEERRISARLRAKDPHFSPDGERIVFVHNEDGTNNLGLINRDGTGLEYLTNNNDATQYSAPRFSPDGEWILFSIFRGEDRDIAMIRAASPPRSKDYGFRDRTETPDSLKVFPDSLAFPDSEVSGFRPLLASRSDERDPYWLPDGSGFVFASDRTGVFNIYEYRLENGEVRQLTNVVGGAFSPAVSPAGRVVYARYRASDYNIYAFAPEARPPEIEFAPVAARDYQSIFQGSALADEYEIQRYGGRKILNFTPLLNFGPTVVGNDFGLDQISGGLEFSTGEMFGGQRFIARVLAGKNFRESTDLNTDFMLHYEKSLRPMIGNNRTFNPSFYATFRRREIDNVLSSRLVGQDAVSETGPVVVPLDSTRALLIPNAEQRVSQVASREDFFKRIFEQATLGINMPLTRRQRLGFQYMRRNYDETWRLRRFSTLDQVFLVQDGVDITEELPDDLRRQEAELVDRDTGQNFYNSLDYYTAHEFSLSWQYQNWKPTTKRSIEPNGRAISLLLRYALPTLTDSLAQQTSLDGTSQDLLKSSDRRLRVNEYVGSYAENLGLPFGNALSLRVMGAYRNLKLKSDTVQDGGLFEGRFYWPLRYYLGGYNLLSGYPYFTASGSKLLYGRVGYKFPLARRLNMRFLNFTFAKLFGEVFAEAGAVGNFNGLDAGNLDSGDFLTDVGGELRLQIFTFYRIPMSAFFHAAHPLNRDRVRADSGGRNIDNWRFYFGLRI